MQQDCNSLAGEGVYIMFEPKGLYLGSMKSLLQKSIIPLIFFYLLSALEVNVGDYIQTFGDEYDSYITSNEVIAKVAKEISKLPATTFQIIPSFFSSIKGDSALSCSCSYEKTILHFGTTIPLHLKLLRLLI